MLILDIEFIICQIFSIPISMEPRVEDGGNEHSSESRQHVPIWDTQPCFLLNSNRCMNKIHKYIRSPVDERISNDATPTLHQAPKRETSFEKATGNEGEEGHSWDQIRIVENVNNASDDETDRDSN